MKKRVLSVLLAIVMVVTALPMAAFAKEEVYPVVIDGGYSSSEIFRFDEDGNILNKVWHFDVAGDDNGKGLLMAILEDVPELAGGNLEWALKNDPERLLNQISNAAHNAADQILCNPDGTPKHNTGPWPTKPEESNMKYIYDNMESNPYLEGTVHEGRYVPVLCEKLGEENVFQFCVDWRQAIVLCAKDLGLYIKSVLDYTGAKKVNIFSESHGGQTTGTYIALCSIVDKGGEAAQQLASILGMNAQELKDCFNLDYVNNAVLNSPAIGGVQMFYDIISGDIHFDAPRIMDFVEYANNPFYETVGGDEYIWEAEYEIFLSLLKLDYANGFFNMLVQYEDLMYGIILTFGSLWDFIDVEHYDSFKASKLDTPERQAAYAPIIKYTDYAHYQVMPNLDEYLSYAREKGVNVSIICGTDITPVSGSSVSSDGLVLVSTASGAKTSDYGYRFSNGYTTDVTDPDVNCTDKTHNHVSPAMNIDAAYGYLPDNTWYIEGQYHAQYAFDDYALELTNKLLLTDDLKDVYTDPAYPQFETTYNAKSGIHAAFDVSLNGRASASDSALVIKNISEKSNIEIVAVNVEGADVSFEDAVGKKIAKGGELKLPLAAPINEKGMTNFTVTVYFIKDNSAFSIDSRRFNFTVDNADLAEYNSKKPQTAAKISPVYITSTNIVETLSNFSLAQQIKAMIISAIQVLTVVITVIKNNLAK